MNKFLVIVFFFSVSCHSRHEESDTRMPNIILLFSDQHNKSVMGYEGHPDVLTPNLDQLAGESFVFDRAYCVTGICAPSRSSLMSGIYPRTLGLLSNSERTQVMQEVISMPSMLKSMGYKTYAYGKRHTSAAIDEGWDVHKSHLCDESPEDNYVTWVAEQGYGEAFAADWSAEFGRGASCSNYSETSFPTADLGTRISELPEELTMEAYTAKLTRETIRNHESLNQPFFIWATFYRPHQPYTPQKRFWEMYDVSHWGNGTKKQDGIKKPASFDEPVDHLPPFLQAQRRGGNKVWNMDKADQNEQLWRNYIGAYYALVSEVDHYVGEIIAQLEESGVKEETIIIYTSDHGDFVGNHGMVEKAAMGHNVYEDILQIPLIIHYAGQQKGAHKYELVSQVDILPTILEMIGEKKSELTHPLQGKSLHSLMKDNTPLDRRYVVSESWSQAAVITDDLKLGIMLDPTTYRERFDFREFGDMLFDRTQDSLEVNNQINNPNFKDQIARLQSFYQEFKEEIPDIGKRQVINQFYASKN